MKNFLGHEICDDQNHDADDGSDDVVVVLFDGGFQLVLGHKRGEIPAHSGQDGVPESGTYRGVLMESDNPDTYRLEVKEGITQDFRKADVRSIKSLE